MNERDQLAPAGSSARSAQGLVVRHRWWLVPLFVGVVAAVLFAVYRPVLGAPFLWDDDAHLSAHKCIVGPLGFAEIWTTAEANYFPLVLTHFWVLHKLFGLDPTVYHVATILLHVLGAAALWRVLVELRIPGAWLGATLWALHPVHVESIAWISEFTNTQSGLLFFLGLWFGVKWLKAEPARTSRWGAYALALVCALGAMLSKPSTVMFPVALALCAWWLHRHLRWRTIAALVPFFALSLGTSAWAVWEQKFHSGALGADWNQTLAERLGIAGRVVWFYLAKLFWPDPLTFVYPRWQAALSATAVLAIVALAIAAALLGWRGRRSALGRAAVFAGLFFVALLFPVLGFFNVYYFRYSFVADHFQYLASAGPLALLGAVLAGAAASTRVRTAMSVAGIAVLVAFAVRSRAHVYDFASSETLWRSTLRDNPECVLALSNLGAERLAEGKLDEARAFAEKAVAAEPTFGEPYFNLAKVYAAVPDEKSRAIDAYRKALRYSPSLAAAYCGLADVLMTEPGGREEAIRDYREALTLDPRNATAHMNLALALGAQRELLSEAMTHADRALELDPDSAEVHLNRGLLLAKIPERRTEAMDEFRAAIRLRPDYAKAHLNLGMQLLATPGTQKEAAAELETAVRLEPNSPIAHNNLGVALAQLGDTERAVAQIREALRLDPTYPDARNNLAYLEAHLSSSPAKQ